MGNDPCHPVTKDSGATAEERGGIGRMANIAAAERVMGNCQQGQKKRKLREAAKCEKKQINLGQKGGS